MTLLLALVAAAPFLSRPGLPHGTDAELHVYRAAELGHTLRQGVLYSRWAPDFYYGYGYPIFNYYAPLTYYLANLFDLLLPGVGIVGGVKAVFVLGLFAAAYGAYGLGRALFGPGGGLLVAACYVFSPYVVFIDPHARGVLAEHFAICLLPLVFFTFHRVVSGVGGKGAMAGCVLSLAALLVSHNLLAMVSVCLLFAYWLWEIRIGTRTDRVGWGALALMLALTLVSFFWIPAVLERGAIKLDVVGPGHFDFRRHFVPLAELLAPSRILDLGAVAPDFRHNLGLAQWLLALFGLAVVWRHRDASTGRTVLFFLLAGLGLIGFMLPISVFLWERIPLMAYLQFPWRLLGPANLMLAVSGGSLVTLFPAPTDRVLGRWRYPSLAVLLLVILLMALPVLYPPMWSPDFGPVEPADIVDWELNSLALGTTSTGDFLPVDVYVVHPEAHYLATYRQPGPVDRVNRPSLPEGVQVEILDHGPISDRLLVATPEPFVLRLFTFYFPGWRAYIDGRPAKIQIGDPEGFITVTVPAGTHEVLVRLEDTPARTAGWTISGCSLGMLGVALVLMPGPRAREKPIGGKTVKGDARNLLLWCGGSVLLFIAFKSGVVDPRDNWMRYTSPPGQAWAAQHELRANFGQQIELLGYDLPRRQLEAGGTLELALYWRALAPMGENYQSFVHFAQPLDVLWGQEDHLNPGSLPTSRWPLNRYVRDEYEIRISAVTPPGEYAVNIGLYSYAGGYRLLRLDDEGRPVEDSLVIATVVVAD